MPRLSASTRHPTSGVRRFLLEHADAVGDDALRARALEVPAFTPRACVATMTSDAGRRRPAQVIDWSFEAGWDDAAHGGGLLYYLDCGGFSPTQLEWDRKLWWPHAEAMVAFA